MQLTNLVDLPVEVTQVLVQTYGEGLTPGCSVCCKATVAEGEISFVEEEKNFSLWEEESDNPSIIAKIMNGNPLELDELQGSLSIKTGNGDSLLETADVHKLSVGKVTFKRERRLEIGFTVSFYNNAETLFAAQKCKKQEDLTLSTDLAA